MSTSTELIQLGTELWLKPGYGGISLVRRDTHGHILIGIFTDRLREYATDWDMEKVMQELNAHEDRRHANDYKRGYEEGKRAASAAREPSQ